MAGTARIFKKENALPGAAGLLAEIMTNLRLVVDDLETLRTSGGGFGALINEIRTDVGTVATWEAEVDADLDDINDYLAYLGERDGVIASPEFVLATTAALTLLGAGRIRYRIGGVEYETVVDTTITLTDNTTVTQGTDEYKAWRIVIDRSGAISTETLTSATGVATEEQALLELGGVARAANTIDIGYAVVQADAADFIPNTSNTNLANTSWTFYELRLPRSDSALHTALGSSLIETTGTAKTWAVGTVNAQGLGVRLAQIGAQTAQAISVADTIADTKFGGWLFVVNLAGTDIVSLNSSGAVAVTAMDDGSDAGVVTALDTVADRLPALFVPIGTIRLENQSSAGFTADTTNWNVAGLTVSKTDYTVGVKDRTVAVASLQGRQLTPPAIPATVSAAAVVAPSEGATDGVTVTAGALTAHDQTLS